MQRTKHNGFRARLFTPLILATFGMEGVAVVLRSVNSGELFYACLGLVGPFISERCVIDSSREYSVRYSGELCDECWPFQKSTDSQSNSHEFLVFTCLAPLKLFQWNRLNHPMLTRGHCVTKSHEVQSAHDVQAPLVRACVDSVQQELRDTREVTTRSQESEEQLPEWIYSACRLTQRFRLVCVFTDLATGRSKHPRDCDAPKEGALNSCASCQDPKGSERAPGRKKKI